MSHPVIGVLALQGAFKKHIEMLQSINVEGIEVRHPEDLLACNALIIPGGESTVISRQLKFGQFEEAFKKFLKEKPVFGTCAGLILMSKEVLDSKVTPFGLIDIQVERNAFGRQTESFKIDLELALGKEKIKAYPGIFIRAPRIRKCESSVNILANYENEPVLVQQGNYLAATFHPELTDDPSVHRFFYNLVKHSLLNRSQQK